MTNGATPTIDFGNLTQAQIDELNTRFNAAILDLMRFATLINGASSATYTLTDGTTQKSWQGKLADFQAAVDALVPRGIQSVGDGTVDEATRTVSLPLTFTDATTGSFAITFPEALFQGGSTTPATLSVKVFTRTSSSLPAQSTINSQSEDATTLPYREILGTQASPPSRYLIIAYTGEIHHIFLNGLTADETVNDIVSAPLGDRFIRSEVQTVGSYSVVQIDLQDEINLLETGEQLGLYVG